MDAAGEIATVSYGAQSGKAENPFAARVATKTIEVRALKKKAVPVKLVEVEKAKGSASCKNVSRKKKLKRFKVNSRTGAATVPKGTKKGACKVKAGITVGGNADYAPGGRVVTAKIKAA